MTSTKRIIFVEQLPIIQMVLITSCFVFLWFREYIDQGTPFLSLVLEMNTVKVKEIYKILRFTNYANPFFPNALFLYPLKTSAKLTVFWCFQRVEEGCIWNKWVNHHLRLVWRPTSVFNRLRSSYIFLRLVILDTFLKTCFSLNSSINCYPLVKYYLD